jgi:O-antigen biosynthesis protein WbqP
MLTLLKSMLLPGFKDGTKKRFFDLLLSVAIIAPATLICLVALPMIWIECRASPLFLQIRVGKHQKPFRILKLRTMKSNTLSMASHEVSAAQITWSGTWLRRLKIDELPQIWNVLMGSMSFVGPRPGLPSQTELIQERSARGVFAILPGVTGPSQVAGIDMATPYKLAELDATYLTPWTISRDLQILRETILGKGRGDAATK